MIKFALAGVGYIAERHLQAIKAVGGELIAACDTKDSVGILDKYFINTQFFLNRKHFGDYLFENRPDYLVICTPNHEHKSYLYLADDLNIEAICEKPLITSMEDYYAIADNTNCIVQLRYAENLQDIKPINNKIKVQYFTPRGAWYHKSWKSNPILSGGLIANIGIHLFDLMIHLYGGPSEIKLMVDNPETKVGLFKAGEITIDWVLSISKDKIPQRLINGIELRTEGLHIKAYKEILAGRGIKKEDVKKSIELINEYRSLS